MGNNILGFAHAMLERDCNAYLGALWSVDDRASMLLMIFFYQQFVEERLKNFALLCPDSQAVARSAEVVISADYRRCSGVDRCIG
jgi:hypothetical protein